ncbi:phytoene/squalene synthase family protein [Leuconostoc sp. MS02]|uniref:Phytoene/squalene synthase family protein n=1 Tax=Leuconostoc aquikimchii TaxID=3236804 RepID=A0ABV3S3H9_9LACO
MGPEQARIEPVLAYFHSSKRVIQAKSSSFYFAFSRLPDYQAYSIFVLYDFLRQLDDAADTKNHIKFNALVLDWETASKNSNITLNDRSTIAEKLVYIFQAFAIDLNDMHDMIRGQRQDLDQEVIHTLAQLEYYCYQVAGTVGCMIYDILSTTKITEIRQNIIDVGVALQLTNIIRDVYEDALEDKCFIPTELLASYGIDKSDLLLLPTNKQLRKLLKSLSDGALAKCKESQVIIDRVSEKKSKLSLAVSIDVYQKILLKLIHKNFENIQQRVCVTKLEKINILAKIYIKNLIRF